MTEPISTLPATESTPRKPRPGGGVARLVVTQGPSTGKMLVLTRSRATLGRHSTNDLVIDDVHVSSAHLELERHDDGRLLIRDLRTTNGTWIGSHRIFEAEVGPGALVRVGDTAIRIEIDGRAQIEEQSGTLRFGGLFGAAPEMRELFATLERISPTHLSVLAQGEAGTGKEELARSVHARSTRAAGPFVVLDAANVPPSLAERMLFGQEQAPGGEGHVGVFEQAHGGTLFLDEVGELPLPLQPKLLRVLESGTITRVGGAAAIPVDFRVVAATRSDLRAEIEAGRFREDLFFRLSEARVVLPPLRARPTDLSLLAAHFLEELSAPSQPLTMTPEAALRLVGRRWPGNVRELRNVVARAAALCQDGIIQESDLAGAGSGFRGGNAERDPLDITGTFADAKGRAVERFEAAYLEALLRRCGGNLSKASRQADVARNHLRALLKKRGLYAPAD